MFVLNRDVGMHPPQHPFGSPYVSRLFTRGHLGVLRGAFAVLRADRSVRQTFEANQAPAAGRPAEITLIGSRHEGCAASSTERSICMKLPAADGKPVGAVMVVVALRVSPSGRVSPVMLSKFDQLARYAADGDNPLPNDRRVLER